MRLSTKAIGELPILGKVQLEPGDKPKALTLDLGERILGAEIKGVIELENAGSNTLLIENVTTSCRCTAVYPAKNKIRPEESIKVLVSVSPDKKGSFSSNLVVRTNLWSYRIGLKASVSHALEPEPATFQLPKDSSSFDLAFRIIDSQLPQEKLTFSSRSATKIERMEVFDSSGSSSVRCRFLIAEGALQESDGKVLIYPSVGNRMLPPVEIRVIRKGVVSVVPRNIYGKRNGSDFVFRCFLTGDVPENVKSVLIAGEGIENEVSAKVDIKPLGTTVVATVTLNRLALPETLDDNVVRLSIGESEVSFTLNER
ncbi:MAG: DUF1573 domain-containing protein [Planctomycetota bacterium]